MIKHLRTILVFLFLGAIVNVAVAWGCATWHGNNPLQTTVFDAAGFDKVREEVNDLNFPKDSYISIKLIEQGAGLSVISMEIQSYASGENWVKLWEDKPDTHLTDADVQKYVYGERWEEVWKDRPDSQLIAIKITGTGIEQRLVFAGLVGRPMPPSDEWKGSTWLNNMGKFEWVHINIGFPLKSLSYTPSSSNPYSTIKQAKVWYLPNVFSKLFPSIDELILPYGVVWQSFTFNTIFYAVILWMLWLSLFATRLFIRRKRGRCIKCCYDLRGAFEQGCPECGWGREAKA